MNMPVTVSAGKRNDPSSSLIDISTSSRSRSSSGGGGAAARPVHLLDRPRRGGRAAPVGGGGGGGGPPVHDPLHQLDERYARLVAPAEALDRRVGIDVGQRVGAPLEVVVQLGEPVVEL